MYTENPARDLALVIRAVLSNQVAKFAPKLYVRLTGQTGRGSEEQTAEQVADYFRRCFDEYRQQLEMKNQEQIQVLLISQAQEI